MRPIDLLGKTFERLTVISRAPNSEDGKTRWLCKCVCGNETTVYGRYLQSGKSKSCGCFRKEYLSDNPRIKHGHTSGDKSTRHSGTYNTWRCMIQRATNPNYREYKHYGGRGITVCDRWRNSFIDFLSDMGERPEGLTLDRIDNNGNYEPGNCRWATSEVQQNNKRTVGRLEEDIKLLKEEIRILKEAVSEHG